MVTAIHPRFEAGISFIGTSRFTATVTRFVHFSADVRFFIMTESDMNLLLCPWSNLGHPNFPGNAEKTSERR